MAEEKTAIKIDHVSKTYENTKSDDNEYVLKDISIDVKENEFVCVLGPSGCGKSTLLNLIAGFIKPSNGHIEIHGEDIANKSGKVGVVFQEHALMPWLTVKKNIMMGPSLHHKSKIVCEEIADKYIQMVGLKGMENYYPKQLSGGMQQRVGIARALAMNPKILLMDEPFSALDEFTREKLNEDLLKIWRKTHKTVVFVTHNIAESVFLSDRVVVLSPHPGRVSAVVDIDLPRPRTADMRELPEFNDYVIKLRNSFENVYD